MNTSNKPKIAIIAAHDSIWGMACWNTALPYLLKSYNIVGFWGCQNRLGKHSGLATYRYYLSTFGIWNFMKLCLFSFLVLLGRVFRNEPLSYKSLCRKHGVNYNTIDTPNNASFIKWQKDNHIDILISMAPQILSATAVNTARLGVINKHAALLPENKGLFPYFWACLHKTPQGVSYHLMDETIDTGRILYQYSVTNNNDTSSMIAFYCSVFRNYGTGMEHAISNLLSENFPSFHDHGGSYYSLPNKSDYQKFCLNGGSIIKWRDLWLSFLL